MMTDAQALPMTDLTCVGEARRAAAAMAASISLTAQRASDLAIVVTEMATNIVRHAEGRGEIVLRPLAAVTTAGVEVLAIDRGNGIPDVARACRDGYSTLGSPGTGLGAIARQAGEFDLHSAVGLGTTVFARIWNDGVPTKPALSSLGAVCLAKPGQDVCGDNWSIAFDGDRLLILVADGLGHGPQAAAASRRAVELFHQHCSRALVPLMDALHAGLRTTRGAAVSIAEVRAAARQLGYVGVGNIAATLLSGESRRMLVSHNGTAGVEARRIQAFQYPWPDGARLVMHSDGLSSNWDLQRYPGLLNRHDGIVAATLYRDYRRLQDDVTVVSLSERRMS
jgi:anti-sigma regulatory factor (Ser/Thr protein kinase)